MTACDEPPASFGRPRDCGLSTFARRGQGLSQLPAKLHAGGSRRRLSAQDRRNRAAGTATGRRMRVSSSSAANGHGASEPCQSRSSAAKRFRLRTEAIFAQHRARRATCISRFGTEAALPALETGPSMHSHRLSKSAASSICCARWRTLSACCVELTRSHSSSHASRDIGPSSRSQCVAGGCAAVPNRSARPMKCPATIAPASGPMRRAAAIESFQMCNRVGDRHFDKRKRPAARRIELRCGFPFRPAVVVMRDRVDDFARKRFVPRASELAADARVLNLRDEQPARGADRRT